MLMQPVMVSAFNLLVFLSWRDSFFHVYMALVTADTGSSFKVFMLLIALCCARSLLKKYIFCKPYTNMERHSMSQRIAYKPTVS